MKNLKTLNDLVAKMTPEEHVEARKMGFVLPYGGADTTQKRKWGLRCKQCGEMAMEFLGYEFIDHNGNKTKFPPSQVCIEMLPWTQPVMPPMEVDRYNPKCQHCKTAVLLNNRFIFPKSVVDMAEYHRKRDEMFSSARKGAAHTLAPVTAGESGGFQRATPEQIASFLADEQGGEPSVREAVQQVVHTKINLADEMFGKPK